MRNIANLGTAFQSSLSTWSYNDNEANNALTGYCPQGYAFHTRYEINPWWCLDLKKVFPIYSVNIHPRLDIPDLSNIDIRISTNALNWIKINDFDEPINTFDPYIYHLDNQHVRFIHITKNSMQKSHLYFRQIDVMYDDQLIPFRNVNLIRDYQLISNKIVELIIGNIYEQTEIDIVLKTCTKDDICLELGGSLGGMSTVINKTIHPLQYYVVEANKDMIELMKKNHTINHIKCSIIYGALTSLNDYDCNFYIHRSCLCSSLNEFKNPKRIDKIHMYNFNELNKKLEPTYLICDIEGGEYDLFNKNTDFNKIKNICIEIHSNVSNIEKTKHLLQIFSDNGFKLDSTNINLEKQQVLFFYR